MQTVTEIIAAQFQEAKIDKPYDLARQIVRMLSRSGLMRMEPDEEALFQPYYRATIKLMGDPEQEFAGTVFKQALLNIGSDPERTSVDISEPNDFNDQQIIINTSLSHVDVTRLLVEIDKIKHEQIRDAQVSSPAR